MASRLCKRCNSVRTANRVCADCAAKTACQRCGVEHGLGAQTKYCKECVAKIPCEVYHPKESRRVVRPRMDWRGEEYLGLKPSIIDWARLAAFIDGEGCIRLGMKRNSSTVYSTVFYALMVVTNTDPRLARWCRDVFGMVVRLKKHTPGSRAGNEHKWKPCYFSTASGFRACWILNNCLPWFLLKREQAETVLAHQETTYADGYRRRPGSKTPQDILEYRLSLKTKLAELNKRGISEGESVLASRQA